MEYYSFISRRRKEIAPAVIVAFLLQLLFYTFKKISFNFFEIAHTPKKKH